jgi:hypothetical protein
MLIGWELNVKWMLAQYQMFMVSRCKSKMTSMVLGDSTLESLTPSVNVP